MAVPHHPEQRAAVPLAECEACQRSCLAICRRLLDVEKVVFYVEKDVTQVLPYASDVPNARMLHRVLRPQVVCDDQKVIDGPADAGPCGV